MNYDFSSIGEIIAGKRKENGWTQENFATMIGVSAQAVSKWETGGGYPDLSLIPAIAQTLGISIDELFGGSAADEEKKSVPRKQNDTPLVHSNERYALYSSEEVESIEGDRVRFRNGSTADLSIGEVINYGGNIFLKSLEGMREEELDQNSSAGSEIHESRQALSFHDLDLRGVDSLGFHIDSSCKIQILRSTADSDCASWNANGSVRFMSRLKLERAGSALCFTAKNAEGFFHLNTREQSGEITVYMPMDLASRLEVAVNGRADLESQIDFEESEWKVNGSLTAQGKAFGGSRIKVNGMADLKCHSLKNLDFSSSGKCDLRAERIDGDCDIRVNGKADLVLREGEVNDLKIRINGIGTVDGPGLCAQNADVKISGKGSVLIDRVRGVSIERISPIGHLEIRRRG